MVIREPLTFMHWCTRCTGCPGLVGLGYGPPKAVVWLLQASKAIARG